MARFTMSLDEDLARAVRKAAGKQAISAWLADAARRKLRAQGLLQVVGEWEVQHGRLLDSELAAAERKQSRTRRR